MKVSLLFVSLSLVRRSALAVLRFAFRSARARRKRRREKERDGIMIGSARKIDDLVSPSLLLLRLAATRVCDCSFFIVNVFSIHISCNMCSRVNQLSCSLRRLSAAARCCSAVGCIHFASKAESAAVRLEMCKYTFVNCVLRNEMQTR